MTAKGWLTVGAVAGCAAIVMTLTWLARSRSQREDHKVLTVAVAPGMDLPVATTDPKGTTPELQRTEVASTCKLHLIVREVGAPAAGRVSWMQSVQCHDLMSGLANSTLPECRDDPRASHADVDGEGDLEVRTGEWTWLRFCGPHGRVAFDRVGPLATDATHTLDLSRTPRVHLQVVDSDWQTPVSHAHVNVYASTLAEALASLGARTTDTTGYLAVADLPPGRAIFTTDRADPLDGAPTACPLIWGNNNADVGIVLVQAEPCHDLRLTVLVTDGMTSPVPPKLYLARLDGIRNRLVPQQGTLRPGLQELLFRVPAGSYEVGVLPMGELRVTGGLIEVGDTDAYAPIALTPTQDRTALRLLGPGMNDPPLRVSLELASGLRADDPDLLFVGPFHWQTTEASVPRSSEPRIVTCVGRHRAFVSAVPVVLDAAQKDVDLVPACCLVVEWTMHDAPALVAPMLVADQEGWQIARPFERALIACPGGRMPALVARVVVPFGDFRLEGIDGDRTLWNKTCTANTRQLTVRIDGALP